MHTKSAAQPESGDAGLLRWQWRLRHLAVCTALTALAFLQNPGLTVADTKIDLNINPDGWLLRSLHLWDSTGAFGQLQNQAYGYLWPMGPFFLIGSWLGLPAWVIQRLWWALLLCVAYTGVVRLAGRLGVGTPAARAVAGVAFALSPRILTQLSWSSVESWPSVVAPWVLIPLIGLGRGAPLRRAVAGSALAVAAAGGVNATAVLAVVPLALLWLMELQPLRRRLAAIAAWSGAVVCATVWWLVPLLVLGRYSPPFLDYIESARHTTSITDLITVLRGASYWVAYLGDSFGPALPAGAKLGTDPALVVATIGVAGLGLVGLSRRGMPNRRFLVGGLLLGAALVGFGHVGDLPHLFAEEQRAFLDGAGAPFRNVHKFDVLLRLPLALGIAHLLGLLGRAVRQSPTIRQGRARRRAWLVTATAITAIAGVAGPALAGQLPRPGGVQEVPDYWRSAAEWLDAQAGGGRVLVVPAARFPWYDWGTTTDEITQPLLQGRWAVRNAIPFTPPTTIRLLDAIDSVLSTGAGSAGLADLLARSGVSHVLLRADLDYGRSDTAPPAVVRQALQRSPGLTFEASFGPVRGGTTDPGLFPDHGLDAPMPALQVFRVNRNVNMVAAFDLSDAATVVGGPESLLDIAAAGQLTAAPTVLAGDRPDEAPPGPVIVTDGLRRRDVSFGRLRDRTSATLTADDPYENPVPAHDYLPEWGEEFLTVARYHGILSVQASSSWAQAALPGGSRPEHQPFAAIDGDGTTSWRSAPGSPPVGQWLDLVLENPTTVPEVRLDFDLGAGSLPTRVTVTAGAESATAESFGGSVTINLPGIHATQSLRITIDAVFGLRPSPDTVGISEITIGGIDPTRTLAVAKTPPTGHPATVVLSAAPTIPSCFFIDDRPRCSPDAARGSEDGNRIDRTLTLAAAGDYIPRVWARPQPGAALDQLLDEEGTDHPEESAPTVVASSTAVPDPAGRPGAVLDGDPATAWAPASTDEHPLLHITWPHPRVVTGLRLMLDPEFAATKPASVRVIGDEGVRSGFLDGDGIITFDPPMRTDEVSVLFLDHPSAHSEDPYGNTVTSLPIAVGEVIALPETPRDRSRIDRPVPLPCGSGPALDIGGTRFETRLIATVRDLLELQEVAAEPCTEDDSRLALDPGELRIIASGSALATPVRLALVPNSIHSSATPTATPLTVASWSSAERRVRVADHRVDRILVVRENSNAGWEATVSGRRLTPLVVDGWQQGWLLPAHTSGEVVLRFRPDVPYRAGLFGGGLLLAGLVVLAVLPNRGPSGSGSAPVRRATSGRPGRWSWLPFAAGAASLIMLGGVVGVFIAAIGGVLAHNRPRWPGWLSATPATRRALRTAESWLPTALLLLAGCLYLAAEHRHVAAGPQLVGVLSLGLLWLSTLPQLHPVPVVSASVNGPDVHRQRTSVLNAECQ
ncbi:MAG TPA: alpha-(1-_3)-arabinofuranosyltransferase [Micromonospora sp.]|nr:alpha-(1->3)-arabinofuranosyltransferase [Micromonospora sp.]